MIKAIFPAFHSEITVPVIIMYRKDDNEDRSFSMWHAFFSRHNGILKKKKNQQQTIVNSFNYTTLGKICGTCILSKYETWLKFTLKIRWTTDFLNTLIKGIKDHKLLYASKNFKIIIYFKFDVSEICLLIHLYFENAIFMCFVLLQRRTINMCQYFCPLFYTEDSLNYI